MSENRCGNCKHFGDPETYFDDENTIEVETRFRLCERVKHINESMRGLKRENYDRHPDSAAVADGSGYIAKLIVAEDFGCLLWEPKFE